MNAYNQITLVGRIPNTDKIKYEFHEATNDSGSNARMKGSISVTRNRKPEGEKYYPEDLIPFVAFGANARFMNQYIKRGDYLVITGSLEVSTVEDQDGNRRTFYTVLVDNVRFCPGASSNNEHGPSTNNNSSGSNKSYSSAKNNNGGGFPMFDDEVSSGRKGSEEYRPFG